MERIGLQGLVLQCVVICLVSPTETDSLYRWVGMEKSSPLLTMELLGTINLLVLQNTYMVSRTETVHSWWWVGKDLSSPLRTMELLGLPELPEFQTQKVSLMLPMEIVLSCRWVVEEPSVLLLMETLGLLELLVHQTLFRGLPTETVLL